MDSYGRFWKSFKEIQWQVLDEEAKECLVHSFTKGRTVHLHEMEAQEYNALCEKLETMCGWKASMKKQRSVTLKLLQKIGVDTIDWAKINNFCKNARIAGKEFCYLTLDEHKLLQRKLRAIAKNGGLKGQKKEEPKTNNIKVSLLCVPTLKSKAQA